MGELVPVAFGLLVGLLAVRSSLRAPAVAALAVALGTLATVLTGESRVSWAYVLVDVPLVALVAAGTVLLVRRRADAWGT